MSSDSLSSYQQMVFERIKHIDDDDGSEYWLAREMQIALEYSSWQNFLTVIRKAMLSCTQAGGMIEHHFIDVEKLVDMPNGGQRKTHDLILSRYACYLIVQNGDPAKEVIALGQTYFSMKTRARELEEAYEALSEEEKRLVIRASLKEHNKQLGDAAAGAGIENYPQFHDAGYMGLYNGETSGMIRKRKGLRPGEKILDWMGAEELAANLFRITLTDSKIRNEGIRGQAAANQAHYQVGRKVRETIADMGGTMPEEQPTPEKSIQQLENERRKQLKDDSKDNSSVS